LQPAVTRFLVFILIIFVTGCSFFKGEKKGSVTSFVPERGGTDAVVLEIGLLQLDDTQIEDFEKFWKLLDQQKIPLQQRQVLDQNGIRLGVMAPRPPLVFNQLTARRPVELESLDQVEQQMAAQGLLQPKSRLLIHKQLVNRNGESHQVEVSDIYPEYSWTIRNPRGFGQQPQVISGSGSLVQGSFQVIAIPEGDGSVRLRVTPHILSGPIMPSIGVAEGSFAYDTQRLGEEVSALLADVKMRQGETLVMAPTAECQDLGKLLFGLVTGETDDNRTPNRLTYRVLLIRILNSPVDDLFGIPVGRSALSNAD